MKIPRFADQKPRKVVMASEQVFPPSSEGMCLSSRANGPMSSALAKAPREIWRLRGRARVNADIDEIKEFWRIFVRRDGEPVVTLADCITGSLYAEDGEHLGGCGLYLSPAPKGAKVSRPKSGNLMTPWAIE